MTGYDLICEWLNDNDFKFNGIKFKNINLFIQLKLGGEFCVYRWIEPAMPCRGVFGRYFGPCWNCESADASG